MSWESE
jgi:ABC-type transport system involved in cytochrome bd biosynthesis fused ATPase/permease subunit